MCANCVSTAEVYAAQVLLAGAVLRGPVHRALAQLGIVDEPEPARRDARTVGFLRALDLDPVDVLGAETVRRAEVWSRQVRDTAPRSRLPIGSHSMLATQ
jgi:hypothetical protein